MSKEINRVKKMGIGINYNAISSGITPLLSYVKGLEILTGYKITLTGRISIYNINDCMHAIPEACDTDDKELNAFLKEFNLFINRYTSSDTKEEGLSSRLRSMITSKLKKVNNEKIDIYAVAGYIYQCLDSKSYDKTIQAITEFVYWLDRI